MDDLLIADDDRVIRRTYAALFAAEGFAVRTAKDGEEALALFRERIPDVVLLDVMMPKTNGIATCERIRRLDPLVPILFFTAFPSEVSLVRGLGLGADDYIDKSRPPAEFVARVRAALRRRRAAANAAAELRIVLLGNAEVDFDRLTAKVANEVVHLTKSEGDLLWLLHSAPGKFFTYDEIFDVMYGRDYVGDRHSLQVITQRLRQKLPELGRRIRNVRRLGYALEIT